MRLGEFECDIVRSGWLGEVEDGKVRFGENLEVW